VSKDAYAAAVSALRSKAGLTQQQVADELGVSLQTVKNFEAGRNRPRADTEKRLAAVYPPFYSTTLMVARMQNTP
jgi:transcriptional regulator with XRE-family HTH domain